jgi:hypothetical protein
MQSDAWSARDQLSSFARVSPRHTRVLVLVESPVRRLSQPMQCDLESGDVCLEVRHLLLLVLERSVHIWQGHDGCACPVDLPPHCGRLFGDILDAQLLAIAFGLTGCLGLVWVRIAVVGPCDAADELVEVGEDVKVFGARHSGLRG